MLTEPRRLLSITYNVNMLSHRNHTSSSEFTSPEHSTCSLCMEEQQRDQTLVTGPGTKVSTRIGPSCHCAHRQSCPSLWVGTEVLLTLSLNAALPRKPCWCDEELKGPVPNANVSPEQEISQLLHFWLWTKTPQRFSSFPLAVNLSLSHTHQ